jgi:hypothetical protein
MTHQDSEPSGFRRNPTAARSSKKCSSWGHVLPWVLLLCSAGGANGDILMGNLSDADSGTNGFSTVSPFEGWASSFTMGANAYQLSDIRIVLSGAVTGAPVFQLESDNGAPSDIALVTLVNPIFLASGINTYTFTPSSALILQANTTYWLTATSTTSTATHLETTTGAAPSGAAAAYGMKDASTDGVVWGGVAGNVDMFEVDGTLLQQQTSAPEPGSGWLAAIGFSLSFLAIGWKTIVRRRLRTKAVSAQ